MDKHAAEWDLLLSLMESHRLQAAGISTDSVPPVSPFQIGPIQPPSGSVLSPATVDLLSSSYMGGDFVDGDDDLFCPLPTCPANTTTTTSTVTTATTATTSEPPKSAPVNYPCPARDMPAWHSSAHFVTNPRPTHGFPLRCSEPRCCSQGVKFKW
jgi:hypothetical protein